MLPFRFFESADVFEPGAFGGRKVKIVGFRKRRFRLNRGGEHSAASDEDSLLLKVAADRLFGKPDQPGDFGDAQPFSAEFEH